MRLTTEKHLVGDVLGRIGSQVCSERKKAMVSSHAVAASVERLTFDRLFKVFPSLWRLVDQTKARVGQVGWGLYDALLFLLFEESWDDL